MRQVALFISFVLVFCTLVSAPAAADYSSSRAWFNRLSVSDRTNLQLYLILAGHYSGFADARFGPITYSALIEFEREQRLHVNGILNRNEADRLLQVSNAVHRELDFRFVADRRTGLQVEVPSALFAKVGDSDIGTVWETEDATLALDSLAFDASEVPFQLLFGLMASKMNLGTVTYQKFEDQQFVLSGQSDDRRFYALVRRNGQHSSGFVLRWSVPVDAIARRVAIYMAASARFFAASVQSSAAGSSGDGPNRPESENGSPGPASGTGFFVSTTGLILTNFHVISSCIEIKVTDHGPAEVLRISVENDLAALLVRPPTNQNTAVIKPKIPPLGSSIVAGGYPLSDIFGSQFTVAFGQVTGRKGLKGTRNQYSMSVPVQPGNSGGPVVNDRGEVVGVAAAKLNDAVMMEVAGTTGANFSFAIDPSTVEKFLRPFAMETRNALLKQSGDQQRSDLSNEELVANIETYTVQIICELQR